MPERLEPALAGDEHDFVVLGSLQQAANAAGEGLVRRSAARVANVIEAQLFLPVGTASR
jgi:hypothetical protein